MKIPVFSFQMQLQPGWGNQLPKAMVIGQPDLESLFKKIGDVVTFYTTAPVNEPVAWGVFEGGNLHDMFFSKEEADHMAQLKGVHAEVRPLVCGDTNRRACLPIFKLNAGSF